MIFAFQLWGFIDKQNNLHQQIATGMVALQDIIPPNTK